MSGIVEILSRFSKTDVHHIVPYRLLFFQRVALYFVYFCKQVKPDKSFLTVRQSLEETCPISVSLVLRLGIRNWISFPSCFELPTRWNRGGSGGGMWTKTSNHSTLPSVPPPECFQNALCSLNSSPCLGFEFILPPCLLGKLMKTGWWWPFVKCDESYRN